MCLPLRIFSPTSRVAWSILDCARRTSTFLSCAFREQEDDQTTPLFPRPRRLMRSVVLAHDDFPDPFVRKFNLPARHR
jgi:hypothetical protein